MPQDALGPYNEEPADEEEDEGIAIARDALGKDDLKDDLRNTEREAADDRSGKAPEAAQHCCNKSLENGREAHKRINSARRAMMKMAARPASAPEITKAMSTTWLARMPMRRTVLKSLEAARMARPILVLRRRIRSSMSANPVTAPSRICRTWIRTPPTEIISPKKSGVGTALERVATTVTKKFLTMILRPKAVRSPVVAGAFRIGRKAVRSNTTAAVMEARMPIGSRLQALVGVAKMKSAYIV